MTIGLLALRSTLTKHHFCTPGRTPWGCKPCIPSAHIRPLTRRQMPSNPTVGKCTHDHVNDSGFHWPAAPSPRRTDPMKDPMSDRASAMDK